MPARTFAARRVMACSTAQAFAWVADHRNVPKVLEGVSRWTPLGARTRGVGARYRVALNALGLALESVLVIDRWEPPTAIGWRSESGRIEQVGGWRFRPRGAGTEVTLTISYQPPLGAFGGLLAGRVDGAVRGRLERALEAMGGLLEGGEGA